MKNNTKRFLQTWGTLIIAVSAVVISGYGMHINRMHYEQSESRYERSIQLQEERYEELNIQYERSAGLNKSIKEIEEAHYQELKMQYEELMKPHTEHDEVYDKLLLLIEDVEYWRKVVNYFTSDGEVSENEIADINTALKEVETERQDAVEAWRCADYDEANKRIEAAYDSLVETEFLVGGGGGAGGDLIVEFTMEDDESYYFISTVGRLEESIDITSEDGWLNVFVQEGTIALDEDGDPLTSLEFTVDETPPPPPADAEILGLPWNFEPDGATFNPLITVTWSYEPSDISGGVDEEDLRIAYYDEGAGEWVVIPAVVDPLSNTITAYIGNFTTFAIIVYAAPPPPLPLPAAFTVGLLIVSPPEVNTGETVSISVLVTNIGETAGSYVVTLKINGEIEATEEITLPAGASETVTFTTASDEAATYLVNINGITGSFAVAEELPPPPAPEPPPTPPARPSRWLIIGIICAVAAAIAIPLTLRWRERRY